VSGEYAIALVASTAAAATPLALASLGELVTERAGVLNLGVEGMMLVGAIAGFAAGIHSGSLSVAFLAAIAAGIAMSLIFGVLALTLQTNQVATGLALTLFGIGLSAFFGRAYAGMPMAGLKGLSIPVLSELPLVGALVFRFDALVYLSIALFALVQWFLYRTRGGLILRAVGESPPVAHAVGHPVVLVRYLAVMFGGGMAGLAGAYLSCVLTPMWAEGLTAGRGWIALALVVFATWRPWRALLGAYLFGGVTILQLHAQGSGFAVPSEFMAMLPYVATIVVLVLICRNPKTILLNQPGSLGRAFHADT
jgi:simple sugar transport system permease protein